ncbi:MAG TPA: hypothetical protein VJ895_02820 [Candidatus Nanoarchaeia archaeon]|nr:hypothetical protein [Candidatus Nanoarchaeia archaeon]
MAEKKYFFNGRKIKGIQMVTVIPDISREREFSELKNQLFNYVSNSPDNGYCLDFSKVKNFNYVSNSISVMMNFNRYCVNNNKKCYFVSNSKLKPFLEKSHLVDTLFKGNVFDSKEQLENFIL